MILSRDEAHRELDRRGISIAEFSRAHGLYSRLVSDLLAGHKKGLRVEAHRAAVLLYIKKGVVSDTDDYPPTRPS